LQVQKVKWAEQKKGEMTNKYVTKRGFYMNYDLKNAKAVPSACSYLFYVSWSWIAIAMEIYKFGKD